MNLTVLKSTGFWITLVTTLVGLFISSGVVLSGSTIDQVLGYILALGGALGGHHVAATGASADPAAPAAPIAGK